MVDVNTDSKSPKLFCLLFWFIAVFFKKCFQLLKLLQHF